MFSLVWRGCPARVLDSITHLIAWAVFLHLYKWFCQTIDYGSDVIRSGFYNNIGMNSWRSHCNLQRCYMVSTEDGGGEQKGGACPDHRPHGPLQHHIEKSCSARQSSPASSPHDYKLSISAMILRNFGARYGTWISPIRRAYFQRLTQFRPPGTGSTRFPTMCSIVIPVHSKGNRSPNNDRHSTTDRR